MPRTFDCPKCGAPVDYAQSTFGGDFTVRCSYCNSTLAQPNDALGRPAHVIKVDLRGATEHLKPLRWLWLLLAIPAFGVLAGVVALFVGLIPVFWSSSNRNTSSSNGNTSSPPSRTSPRTDERVLLKFGSEGIGPGMFKDARSIAIDASGNIYVGEYLGGRVQVFDGNGKFITQWTVDPNMPLRGFAADRKGQVDIAQKGQILRYEGSTGKQVGEIAYADASRRLTSDIPDKVSGGSVVSVEFFFVRTLLLADIDGAADAHHTHKIVERASNRDTELTRALSRAIAIIERRTFRLAGKFIHMRSNNPADGGSFAEAQCFIVADAGRRIRTGIKIHAIIGF